MANGNGLMREFVETKERATAWAFRLLITVATLLTSGFTYLAWHTFTDLKDEVKEQNKLHWATIEAMKDHQTAVDTSLGILSQSVHDLHTLAQDHEARIRGLERPGMAWPH